MAELGQDNFLYVADSALVTPENLALMDDWKSGLRFVSRPPASYKEYGKAIAKAVRQDSWHDLGALFQCPFLWVRRLAYPLRFERQSPTSLRRHANRPDNVTSLTRHCSRQSKTGQLSPCGRHRVRCASVRPCHCYSRSFALVCATLALTCLHGAFLHDHIAQ
jgi:hypothetical protein